ncbi:MAG: bacterioferritin [Oligoflexales bacterium]
MKGNPEVIEILNKILTNELTAINQYFLHARMCKDWGYERIAAKVHAESIDEMKHASQLIDRILFLEGVPNVQRLGKINIGENVKEQLVADLGLENIAIPDLRDGVEICLRVGDHGTREMFEHILSSEEEHVDWLESQLHQIEELGYANYLMTVS